MTEIDDDKPKTEQEKSFKEQILSELEEAKRSHHKQSVDFQSNAKTTTTTETPITDTKSIEGIPKKNKTVKNDSEVDDVLKDINHLFTPNMDKDIRSSLSIRENSDTPTIQKETSLSDFSTSNVSNQSENVYSKVSDSLSDLPKNLEKNVKKTRKRTRQKTDSLARRIALSLILVIVVVLLATGFFGYRYVKSAVGALDKTSTRYITVDIPEGSGNKYIGQLLEKAGVIKSATVFNYYTKFKNYSDFKFGYYNLKTSMDLDEICKLLQKNGAAKPEKPSLGKILITEGSTIKQISEAVTKNTSRKKSSTPFTAVRFLSVVKDDTFISKMVEKYPRLLANLPNGDVATYRLEGYLFPATYSYYKNTTMEDLVEQMISTMDSYMSRYYDTIAEKGMTVNDILSIASLVEKEGATDEDRRNIASVFYNRLKANMPLQSNIAILYAIGKLGEKTNLAADRTIDTSIVSPYNVYTNTGLPPGPVDSPSLSAIEATVNPATTDDYYFVADVKTGNVYYSKTYEDHEANVEKYVNNQVDKE